MTYRYEKTHDLLTNLFTAYEANPNKVLGDFKLRKKDNYDKGRNVIEDALLTDMLNKYNTLVESGRFKMPTDAEREIVALKAAVTIIQASNVQLSAKLKKKDWNKKDKNGSGTNNKGKRKWDHDQWTQHNPNKVPRTYKGSDAWKSQPPKANEKKEKIMNGKTYYWCEDHKAWTVHHPDHCKWRLDRLRKKPVAKKATVETDTDSSRDSDLVARPSVMLDKEKQNQKVQFKKKAADTFLSICSILESDE